MAIRLRHKMRPVDIPTRETARFIESQIIPGSQIVEVGCGEGEVAFGLSQNGYEVTALDSDRERVAKTRELGVRAVVASWPEFQIDPVDAILFTRSLHHISPLEPAIERARLLLKSNGVLLVEDFAVESITEQTLKWFQSLLHSDAISRVIEPEPQSFVAQLLGASHPITVWEHHHAAHDVHRFDELHEVIAQCFSTCKVEPVPYLYRYVVSVVPQTNEAADLVRECLRTEVEAGKRNAIALIGRRVVATIERVNDLRI